MRPSIRKLGSCPAHWQTFLSWCTESKLFVIFCVSNLFCLKNMAWTEKQQQFRIKNLTSYVFTVNVQCQMDETRESLEVLQDIVDTQELREKQLDHRFELALYQERRLKELEDLKGNCYSNM